MFVISSLTADFLQFLPDSGPVSHLHINVTSKQPSFGAFRNRFPVRPFSIEKKSMLEKWSVKSFSFKDWV